jgi:hypothetical protein
MYDLLVPHNEFCFLTSQMDCAELCRSALDTLTYDM